MIPLTQINDIIKRDFVSPHLFINMANQGQSYFVKYRKDGLMQPLSEHIFFIAERTWSIELLDDPSTAR